VQSNFGRVINALLMLATNTIAMMKSLNFFIDLGLMVKESGL